MKLTIKMLTLNELAIFFTLKESRDYLSGAIGNVIMSDCENDKDVFVHINKMHVTHI